MRIDRSTCIEDLRQIHRRRVPKAFFEYADRGSYAEETLRANRHDFETIKLRQRIMRDVSTRDLSTTILGTEADLPLILAPVGLTGLQYRKGEIAACRAAHDAGIPYTLSIMAICSMEEVAHNVEKPFWFQMNMLKDRGIMKSLMDRAMAVGCSALVITVDLPVLGQRHADIKNGMTVPPRWSLGKLLDFASKPSWAASMMFDRKKLTFGNLVGEGGGSEDIESLALWTSSQFDNSATWKDLEWVRTNWPRDLVIKGILDSDDAKEAAETGAQALVVSNHGGRQLDGTRSTIAVLPSVVDAVGSRMEVFVDGGIRCGQDVMRALALGADACMLGRAYIHGLGAGGQRGVSKAIDIIKNEFDVTMGLCGMNRIQDIDNEVVSEGVAAPSGSAARPLPAAIAQAGD